MPLAGPVKNTQAQLPSLGAVWVHCPLQVLEVQVLPKSFVPQGSGRRADLQDLQLGQHPPGREVSLCLWQLPTPRAVLSEPFPSVQEGGTDSPSERKRKVNVQYFLIEIPYNPSKSIFTSLVLTNSYQVLPGWKLHLSSEHGTACYSSQPWASAEVLNRKNSV